MELRVNKEEIREGNKLIADFMGYMYIPWNNEKGYSRGWFLKNSPEIVLRQKFHKFDNGFKLAHSHNCLRYSDSWDWLIKVVEKIENIDNYSIQIELNVCIISDLENPGSVVSARVSDSKIESTFRACVKFIKEYNKINN